MSIEVLALFALFAAVGAVLFRAMSLRAQRARHDRLKAHLDWVNPEPSHSGRRRQARR